MADLQRVSVRRNVGENEIPARTRDGVGEPCATRFADEGDGRAGDHGGMRVPNASRQPAGRQLRSRRRDPKNERQCHGKRREAILVCHTSFFQSRSQIKSNESSRWMGRLRARSSSRGIPARVVERGRAGTRCRSHRFRALCVTLAVSPKFPLQLILGLNIMWFCLRFQPAGAPLRK